MPARLQGPDLTIQVKVNLNGSEVIFSSNRDEPLKINSSLQQIQLDHLRRGMRVGLTNFAKIAEQSFHLQGRERWRRIDQAMRALRELGNEFGARVFGYADIPKIEQYCRDACRWNKRQNRPARIELIVPNFALAPFDLIPLFQRKTTGTIENPQDLEDEANCYLGFAGVVSRTISTAPHIKPKIVARRQLRAKVFQYASLSAVDDVSHDLRRFGISLTESFPLRDYPQPSFEKQMLDFFRKGTEQVFYFGCHCDTTAVNSSRHQFTLRGPKQGRPRDFYLGTLDQDFYQNGPRDPAGPLVFMNACGGASIMPAGSTSFPQVFLEGNFAGFIGTETIIPDRTAAVFASFFFKNFSNGFSLGPSLLAARRHLLNRGDPLGILYTAYAPPEMLALVLNSREE
jgi:hypothetical protein